MELLQHQEAISDPHSSREGFHSQILKAGNVKVNKENRFFLQPLPMK